MAVSIKYIILTTAIIVTIITIITSDIFTPPQGGKYPPPVESRHPPPPTQSTFLYVLVFFKVYTPPKHLSISPQFQIPRNNHDLRVSAYDRPKSNNVIYLCMCGVNLVWDNVA